jgi:hypothetical protein
LIFLIVTVIDGFTAQREFSAREVAMMQMTSTVEFLAGGPVSGVSIVGGFNNSTALSTLFART